MAFQDIIARRMARQIARFSPGEGPVKCWFPASRGPSASAFPTGIDCQKGAAPSASKDVAGLLDRRVRTTTVSFITSLLPELFRKGDQDTIPQRQIVRIGVTLEAAVAYQVTTSNSDNGITQLELEQVS